MKKFIIDTNILVEYFKGNETAKEIIDIVSKDKINQYLLSIDIIEEILYILVRHFSKKPYWEIKSKPDLAKEVYEILIPLLDILTEKFFHLIDTPSKIKSTLFGLCKKYGMLPKDALLAALAIEYKADFVITLDRDFKQLDFVKVITSAYELKDSIKH